MLTAHGRLKIMDFGLALMADRSQLTKNATTLGTPAYMSPEQVRRQPTDRRTDIWSLGVVIYEMLTSRCPFEGEREASALLISPTAREYPTDWSRDGNIVLFIRLGPTDTVGGDLWYLRRRGGTGDFEEVPFSRSPANESVPRLSPDGRFLAYASDESGQFEIYVSSFPDGDNKQRVSLDGGVQPSWRADGRELFFEWHGTLRAVAVSGSTAPTCGPPKPLFESAALSRFAFVTYDVSADGQRFVIAEQVEESSNIIRVTQNWHEEFRDREPE